MKAISKSFGPYVASLQIEEDLTQGWVNLAGGEFSSTLDALLAEGVLTDSRCGEHEVPDAIVKQIEEWAEENGY